MKTIMVKECRDISVSDAYTFNLGQIPVKSCSGCWSCWWKTPGRCIYKDLDVFYHEYITADKAIYFVKVTRGFVSNNLKNLFDRMLPLYLPYVSFASGESMHIPRYDKYPDVEVYYEGSFETAGGQQVFEEYIRRVFYQFHSKNIDIKSIEQYEEKEEVQ